MSQDPRIEAVARALLTFETTTLSLDDVPGPTGRDMYRRATAAVAALDKAATITTVEELDALPELTVLIDSDPDVIEKHDGRWKSMNEDEDRFWSSLSIGLPARVIHWGTE